VAGHRGGPGEEPGRAAAGRLTGSTAGASASPGRRFARPDSLDEAIAIAARHPQANGGKLELRAFWTDEDWDQVRDKDRGEG
jgi:hypothetical protein